MFHMVNFQIPECDPVVDYFNIKFFITVLLKIFYIHFDKYFQS